MSISTLIPGGLCVMILSLIVGYALFSEIICDAFESTIMQVFWMLVTGFIVFVAVVWLFVGFGVMMEHIVRQGIS